MTPLDSTQGDMRAVAANREPRPVCQTRFDLERLLIEPQPPLALGANEVEWIVGQPLGAAGMDVLRYFHREKCLVIRLDDGRELTYLYEGDKAYALVYIEGPDE